MAQKGATSTKVYWITWSVLLTFTLVMVWLDGVSIPRLAFVIAMLVAMLAKASLIASNFMHLRYERVSLILMVVVGLLVTGTLLYVLIVPDAVRIQRMLQ
ncbi:MAG: cytochrome C oxidase subunit IV family protein [Acidobacteria bacterium]|nr:cytochrome C oxidase subunit IV family protein [Acidobacteriota bacterium]